MAVIHSQHSGTTRYEVRSAGHSKRLYTNGVFHSQWNPSRPIAGAVWDLLSLPVLYLPQAETRVLRILLLGVGGGAVLRQLQLLTPSSHLIGIELDPVHLELARDFFDVDKKCAQLHCADAVQWVRDYRGPTFDLVIDDLFSHQNGEPERAIEMTTRWAASLRRLTSKDGVVVANFTSAEQLRDSGLMRQTFERVYRWAQPDYENAIGAFVRGAGDARTWRAALDQHAGLNVAQRHVALGSQRMKVA